MTAAASLAPIDEEPIDAEVLALYGPGLALVAFDLVLEEKRRQAAPVQPTARMATRAEQHAAGTQRWRVRAQELTAAAAAGD